jgi:hypothetical protein
VARIYNYNLSKADLLSPAAGRTADDFFVDWRLPQDTKDAALLCAELVRLAYVSSRRGGDQPATRRPGV